MKKYIILIVLFCLSIGFIVKLIQINKQLRTDNDRLQNNIEYYSSFGTENIVLQNTVNELKESKDSLIQHINDIQKKLELKPKETTQIVYVETVIRDTIVETITHERDFSVTVKPNDLTFISISFFRLNK